MPMCQLSTNLPRAKVDETFAKELSEFVAKTLGKDEKVVTLQVNPDQIMVRSGSQDPMLHLTVHAFTPNYFTDEIRESMVTSLTPFFSEKLGITDLGRIILSFHQVEASHVGIFGKLVSQK
ncbi:macrophage migration inhibitory factor-like [Asterias rubens]|uniref:macrophage migration inhibitory factor-like n=1 Tax=Asterias rubens TaxID=7604 RepID=UPI001455B87C|nr:macrophage migration inhibitory factor-like [Asterias rubens]